MHGNACEWTRSAMAPYPYRDNGHHDPANHADRIVRGGSWRDRPSRATSSVGLFFPPWQRPFNVGFRVIIEDTP